MLGKQSYRAGILAGVIAVSAACMPSAAGPSAQDVVTKNDIEYGPETKLFGFYFTNFENSKFTECGSRADCNAGSSKEAAALDCVPQACDDLENRIVRLNGSHDKWAVFYVEFLGRRSTHPSAKRFLNDTPNKVLLDRILLIETTHVVGKYR